MQVTQKLMAMHQSHDAGNNTYGVHLPPFGGARAWPHFLEPKGSNATWHDVVCEQASLQIQHEARLPVRLPKTIHNHIYMQPAAGGSSDQLGAAVCF